MFFLLGLYSSATAQCEIPRDTTYTVWSTYQKLKKQYPTIDSVQLSSIEGVRVLKNQLYAKLNSSVYGERSLLADVYLPDSGNTNIGLVLIHGGGWRSGDKRMYRPMAIALARLGIAVISIEYRLSLEEKYPGAIHDSKAAIRWVREHAKELNIDPNKIAIGGCSAGGQLASLVGVTNHQHYFEGKIGNVNVSSEVQAIVNMDGLLDFTHVDNLQIKRNEKSADVFWLESSYTENPNKWKEASPITHVSKDTPPVLIIKSNQTRFHAGCNEFVSRLHEYGIYYEVKQIDGPHSYWLFHPWFDPTVKHTVDFLKKIFIEE